VDTLVEHSLAENDLTIVSVFVNPTQFAPHEDLSSYPRTLPRDLELLAALSVAPRSLRPTFPTQSSLLPANSQKTEGNGDRQNLQTRTPSAVFLPSVDVMYPSSVSQVVQEQKGSFVEVKGFGELMEGKSRPAFFRGVATVVTKLFNAVQPSNAYFGQKDIQQALLLRRMVTDLLLAHPTAQTLHIVPTTRSNAFPDVNLALSSRNAYLSASERPFASILYRALKEGERIWNEGGRADEVVRAAHAIVGDATKKAIEVGVGMKLDYVSLNDSWTFESITEDRIKVEDEDVFILSGAMWVGKTRLIDNILLGDSSKILY